MKTLKTFICIYFLLILCMFLLYKNVDIFFWVDYFFSKNEHLTSAGIISALIIFILIAQVISAFVLFTFGFIKWIKSKKDIYLKQQSKSKIIEAILLFGIAFTVWFLINIIQVLFFGISIPSFTMDHFRTNIITGKCDYGGFSGQLDDDPWYFKPDCKLDKKIKTAKEEGFYEMRLEECKQYCNNIQKNYFCNTYIITVDNASGNGPENLLCSEIVTCSHIDCKQHEIDHEAQIKEGY